jgi:cytochrome c oxidase assembly protein subunit 11
VTALAQRNTRTALMMALVAAAMVGLAFASVPLYRLFCQVTGFGGTPVRAEEAPGARAAAGQIGVRFDANINSALPWKFEPVQRTMRIVPGEQMQVAYRAKNLSARATTGTAVFNVTPAKAGQYFSKIQCFCFSEQTLKAGESIDMPVIFFVDPKIREDESTKDIDEITLSYTFYPVETPAAAR